jgi:hypothetical protein
MKIGPSDSMSVLSERLQLSPSQRATSLHPIAVRPDLLSWPASLMAVRVAPF